MSQVGLDRERRVAAEECAIDLQVLHHPLHIVAAFHERYALELADVPIYGAALAAVRHECSIRRTEIRKFSPARTSKADRPRSAVQRGAISDYVEVVLVPLARWTRSRCALKDQIVFFHLPSRSSASGVGPPISEMRRAAVTVCVSVNVLALGSGL